MDFSELSAANILANLLVSCIGMGFFMYGKKAQRIWPLLGGIALSVIPWLVTDWRILWPLTIAIIVLLYFMRDK